MTIKEFYRAIGSDYENVVYRFGSDEVAAMLAPDFLADDSYGRLKAAALTGDPKETFEAAHTLKGVAANLGFDRLAEVTSVLVEQLRPQTEPMNEEMYARVCACCDDVLAKLSQVETV